MLPLSKKPEILRLHQLEKSERSRFISQFSSTVQDYIPQNLWKVLPIIADVYFSYTLICKCRRRLGQQYVYVAMYNQKHYEEQGVLMNSKYRTIMFILQIIQRHFLKQMISKLLDIMGKNKIISSTKYIWKIFDELKIVGSQGLMQQGYRFILMLFLIGRLSSQSLVDNILGTQYVYTYKNQKQTKIKYNIQGYLLLSVFIVKILRFFFRLISSKQPILQQNIQKQQSQAQSQISQTELCRICYDKIKNKSSTFCGHIFCWKCIIKYLQSIPQCPVCRSKCKPKEVVQLQNY